MKINTKDSFNSRYSCSKKNRVPHVSAPREQRSVRSVRSVCKIKKIRVQIKKIRLIRVIRVQKNFRVHIKIRVHIKFVFKIKNQDNERTHYILQRRGEAYAPREGRNGI